MKQSIAPPPGLSSPFSPANTIGEVGLAASPAKIELSALAALGGCQPQYHHREVGDVGFFETSYWNTPRCAEAPPVLNAFGGQFSIKAYEHAFRCQQSAAWAQMLRMHQMHAALYQVPAQPLVVPPVDDSANNESSDALEARLMQPSSLSKVSRQAPAPELPRHRQGSQKQARPQAAAHTLSSSLQAICDEDPDTLFIVRRINKLGFKACRTLKHHFSAYGLVVRALAAHSTVRQHGDQAQSHARRRPSSLGFVQMASAQAVQEILALGSEHEIDGCTILVQKFERQGVASEEMEEDGDGEEDSRSARCCRAFSEVSTATGGSSSPCSVARDSDSDR